MVRAVIRGDPCKQCHVPDSESGLSHATLAGSAYNGAHYSQIRPCSLTVTIQNSKALHSSSMGSRALVIQPRAALRTGFNFGAPMSQLFGATALVVPFEN